MFYFLGHFFLKSLSLGFSNLCGIQCGLTKGIQENLEPLQYEL